MSDGTIIFSGTMQHVPLPSQEVTYSIHQEGLTEADDPPGSSRHRFTYVEMNRSMTDPIPCMMTVARLRVTTPAVTLVFAAVPPAGPVTITTEPFVLEVNLNVRTSMHVGGRLVRRKATTSLRTTVGNGQPTTQWSSESSTLAFSQPSPPAPAPAAVIITTVTETDADGNAETTSTTTVAGVDQGNGNGNGGNGNGGNDDDNDNNNDNDDAADDDGNNENDEEEEEEEDDGVNADNNDDDSIAGNSNGNDNNSTSTNGDAR